MIVAADRSQAKVIRRYVEAILVAVPTLAEKIEATTSDAVTLSNNIVIEVKTANFRTVRGFTCVMAICDELAFWRSEDSSANPDRQILEAIRPAQATVRDPLLLCISSPYARRGELYRAWEAHHGRDGDPVLVWQADTRTMNPTVPQAVIDRAYADDPVSAAAEFGALFRTDVESFVSREAVEACVVPGRVELPPSSGLSYIGFLDPAGGSGGDSFAMCIAHPSKDRVVVDVLRECRPPFSPDDVTAEFAQTLRAYRVSTVYADRWGGEWPVSAFRHWGIWYRSAKKTKSELYRDLLPMLNARRVELLDLPRLKAQLLGLERRTARGGRDSIDHAPRQHDDVINVCAGAIDKVRASGDRGSLVTVQVGPQHAPCSHALAALRRAKRDRQALQDQLDATS